MEDNEIYKALLFSFVAGVFFLAAIHLVSAEENFRIGTIVDLKKTCDNNGSFCSNNSVCNMTVYYPNLTVLANNVLMTNQINFHNLTFAASVFTSANTLGTYPYVMVCDDGAFNSLTESSFILSQTGTSVSTSGSIIYFAFLVLGIIFFLLALGGAIVIPSTNEYDEMSGKPMKVSYKKYVKYLLFFVSYLLLIWISWTAWNIHAAFLSVDAGTSFFKVIFWALVSAAVPIFVLFVFFSIHKAFADANLAEVIERGVMPR